MMQRGMAGGLALLGLLSLGVGLLQALGGATWALTVGGGLLLLVVAGAILALPGLLAPPAPPPAPVRLRRPPALPAAPSAVEEVPLHTAPASAQPQLPPGRPGTRYIELPGTIMPLHPDYPDGVLLMFLQALTPTDFEHFCSALLTAMGYQHVRVAGKTGDEGVDITMQYGTLRLIAQCKRYQGNVGAPAVRDFYGALTHTRAAKGFFLTTSDYTQAAREWATGKPLDLINGAQLVTAVRQFLLAPPE